MAIQLLINALRSGQHLRFVFYSNGQAAVYSYVPDASVYCVFAGAYIIHDPAGDEIRQLYAGPADVYPLGHVLFAISIYDSTTATYPAGHEVDGAAANVPIGTIAIIKINIRFIFAPV